MSLPCSVAPNPKTAAETAAWQDRVDLFLGYLATTLNNVVETLKSAGFDVPQVPSPFAPPPPVQGQEEGDGQDQVQEQVEKNLNNVAQGTANVAAAIAQIGATGLQAQTNGHAQAQANVDSNDQDDD
ncbi:hypothetical protein ACM66B_003936 [Microbotryomycetes sp. NB124-2]